MGIPAMKAEIHSLNRRIAELEAENERLKELVRWAHETLYEINPSNYDHDEVCKLNDASVEVILGLAHHLGERHGKTDAWWQDHLASSSVPRAEALSRTGAVKVKALHWGIYKSINNRGKLVATDLFGHEFARLVLSSETVDEIEAYKASQQADYERRILSALEPAERDTNTVAPRETGNVGDKIREAFRDGWRHGISDIAEVEQSRWDASKTKASLDPTPPEGQQPEIGEIMYDSWAQVSFLKEKLRQAEADRDEWKDRAFSLRSARPSEQAVTEAMVEAAAKVIYNSRYVYPAKDLARNVLKAAMEAGG